MFYKISIIKKKGVDMNYWKVFMRNGKEYFIVADNISNGLEDDNFYFLRNGYVNEVATFPKQGVEAIIATDENGFILGKS